MARFHRGKGKPDAEGIDLQKWAKSDGPNAIEPLFWL